MTDDFRPIERADGYLPIADYGLIGDGETAALVGRDGSIGWLCAPRFDDPPVFAGLLDHARGGRYTVAPEGLAASRQRYLGDTGVLVTELLDARGGIVRITDTMTLRSGADLTEDVAAARGELLRAVEVLEGRVRLRIELEPRGGAATEPRGDGLCMRCSTRPELDLQLDTDFPFDGGHTRLALQRGDRRHLILRWGNVGRRAQGRDPAALQRATVEAWDRWQANIRYAGPHARQVRRSAITLKLLDHFANGALVAAPTSSLPESIGGVRNWDYRYAWIRDAAFSVYAMSRIGLERESADFLAWVLDVVERGGHPRVLYTLDGEDAPAEREDAELEGYRRSAPVRWGNAAAGQRQHDVYGELMDCAYLWAKRGGTIDDALWARLRPLTQAARDAWDVPDQSIWEVRTQTSQPFTYSAAMCQVAVDRGARIAAGLGLKGDVEAWQADAARIRERIIDGAWDERLGAFAAQLGGGGLDASLLALPLRRLLRADHPRMQATTAAIAERLSPGKGLLYRYLPRESPDGLPGEEGAFLLCSFWLVDNLALQGRLDDALELYESVCARANSIGLLPEQIDPSSGAFLGNFPQALSHVGLITSGVSLATAIARRSA